MQRVDKLKIDRKNRRQNFWRPLAWQQYHPQLVVSCRSLSTPNRASERRREPQVSFGFRRGVGWYTNDTPWHVRSNVAHHRTESVAAEPFQAVWFCGILITCNEMQIQCVSIFVKIGCKLLYNPEADSNSNPRSNLFWIRIFSPCSIFELEKCIPCHCTGVVASLGASYQ